jgi:membrane protease YdiL (CAAX protease family)
LRRRETEIKFSLERNEKKMNNNSLKSNSHLPANSSQQKFPLDYFFLVFALTVPFWLFGEKPLPVPVKLPVSALASVNPMLAAIILTYRREGVTGLKDLFKKALDFRKIKHKGWYLPILFLNPLIMVLSYIVMRVADLPLPDPQIPWVMAPLFLSAFFIFAIGEELGWMGYAFDPMRNRWGALKASLVLGLIWGMIHVIPDMQNGHTANWIFWQRLGTVALRVIIVWIYANSGDSVFSAILFHAMYNLSWTLFPNYGSHYDPFVTGAITLLVTGLVIIGWGPETLARFRLGRLGRPRSSDQGGQATT